jgi:hypothetical protein
MLRYTLIGFIIGVMLVLPLFTLIALRVVVKRLSALERKLLSIVESSAVTAVTSVYDDSDIGPYEYGPGFGVDGSDAERSD